MKTKLLISRYPSEVTLLCQFMYIYIQFEGKWFCGALGSIYGMGEGLGGDGEGLGDTKVKVVPQGLRWCQGLGLGAARWWYWKRLGVLDRASQFEEVEFILQL